MPQALVRAAQLCAVFTVLAAVTACSSRQSAPPASTASRGMYKVGAPYKIDGVTYVPMEEFRHTETGVASWYGPGFHGKSTANGEVYDQRDRTAAHRTLQMPSVLRVTNLDTGQSTIVRVNDRGPFARQRVIDLSRAAAEDVGMIGSGTARVRVEQLETESQALKQIALNGGGPDEQRAALDKYIAGRRGPPAITATAQATPPPPPAAPAAMVYPDNPRSPAVVPVSASGSAGAWWGSSTPTVASIAAASTALPPVPPPTAPAPIPATTSSGFFVQTGAFSSMGNAERQRDLVTSYGATEISQGSSAGREVYRVRVGPYSTQDAAGIVADRLKRSGYGDARVVAD